MTDNNADNTGGQSTNLSRRGAVALLGTAAVGGAATTGAFSKLAADRPIDVTVSDGQNAVVNSTGSNLTKAINITNQVGTGDTLNTSVVPNGNYTLKSSSSNSGTITNSSGTVEISNLNDGDTAQLVFTSKDGVVDFDINAFSNTNGFEVQLRRTLDLPAEIETFEANNLNNWNSKTKFSVYRNTPIAGTYHAEKDSNRATHTNMYWNSKVLDSSTAKSVEGWYYYPDDGSGFETGPTLVNSNGEGYMLYLRGTPAIFTIGPDTLNTSVFDLTSLNPSTNTWYKAVIEHDGGDSLSARVEDRNGNTVCSGSGTDTTSNPDRFGTHGFRNARPIDNVGLYKQ